MTIYRLHKEQFVRRPPAAVFEYIFRVMGIRIRWKCLISDYYPLFGFVDQQVKGPFTFSHHTHTFSEVEGGTLITDEVRNAMPFGLPGMIAQHFTVKRQVQLSMHETGVPA